MLVDVGSLAFLVNVNLYSEKFNKNSAELRSLVSSAGFSIDCDITVSRNVPDSRYFLGRGKIDEISQTIALSQVDIVVFNSDLTPAQQRNLENKLNCKVMDRTELILYIFARRALSFEGKLQVELAMLKHQATRLVRVWTHLERQRGGFGFMGGPGEKQIESDRRLIRRRVKNVTKSLQKVRSQRAQSRKSRRRANLPTVALVGYTNAGKSTLFNQLANSEIYEANQLFATLDPTLRRIMPEVGGVILADTVGFIRDLPTTLIDAFRATLEEVSQADLLLHVVDVSEPDRQMHLSSVESVLLEIGAGEIPQILVYNKIDAGDSSVVITDAVSRNVVNKVLVSAKCCQGIGELRESITEFLAGRKTERTLSIASDKSELLAWLYRQGAVLSVSSDDDGSMHVLARLTMVGWKEFDEFSAQH